MHVSRAIQFEIQPFVVRDLRGRIRLAIKETPENVDALSSLETELVKKLAGYFVAPIISKQQGPEFGRLAEELVRQGTAWPATWPNPQADLLSNEVPPPATWKVLERLLGKEAWLSTKPFDPIWPYLGNRTPVVLTFHSFKGGVGRTTLAAAYAIKLATVDPTKRIAIVDLDLEAPGLAALFGVKASPDARGMLDVFVDHIATGNLDLNEVKVRVTFGSAQIDVFPAGLLDINYLAKLGRLDFASNEPDGTNPVEAALRAFLRQIKDKYDVILLDSRAGLHDLAGIALPALAHVDVLIFRGTTQGIQGLDLTLSRLGRERHIVLAETMLPANDDEHMARRLGRSRESVYEMMCNYNYEQDDPPQLIDDNEPHNIVGIRRKEFLDNLDSIGDRVSEVLQDNDIQKFVARLNDTIELADTTPGDES